MLWVLIRIASIEYPQHMFLWRNKQIYPLSQNTLLVCSSEGVPWEQKSWGFGLYGALLHYGWMDGLGFYVPSGVFQSYQDDGRVNIKNSVRWSTV